MDYNVTNSQVMLGLGGHNCGLNSPLISSLKQGEPNLQSCSLEAVLNK